MGEKTPATAEVAAAAGPRAVRVAVHGATGKLGSLIVNLLTQPNKEGLVYLLFLLGIYLVFFAFLFYFIYLFFSFIYFYLFYIIIIFMTFSGMQELFPERETFPHAM